MAMHLWLERTAETVVQLLTASRLTELKLLSRCWSPSNRARATVTLENLRSSVLIYRRVLARQLGLPS